MVINVVIGVVQSAKIEKTLIGAKYELSSTAKVKRNGKVIVINSEEVVIGDIVYLQAGDIVPADVRLIETNNLFINDTIITGQTMATEKNSDVIDGKYMPLGDRINMAYMGSSVAKGMGVAVVVATGANTELGKTQKLLKDEVKTTTPLIKRLYDFIGILSFIVLFVSVVSFIINIVRNNNVADSFMVAVSLAVCVVPESLIISIYATLSRSIKKLSKNNLVIKNLSAIENIGNIDVLCVDKTDVLTVNNKTVENIWVSDMDDYDLEDNPNFISLINCMLLCNSASTELMPDNTLFIKGSGSEKALIQYAYSKGYSKDSVQGIFPQNNIFPFDRYRKTMTTLNSVGETTSAFTRGDYERIIDKCTHILVDGKSMRLTEYDKQMLNKIYKAWLKNGSSVMGFATKQVNGDIYEIKAEEVEKEMTFVGMVAISDPEKLDAYDSLNQLKQMGVKLIMLTSDDKESAYLVAKSMGIAKYEKQVVTGQELDYMTDVELNEKIDGYTVFSKLLSGQKLRIIKALQKNNVVAVTGNNVEDLSSLKQADVGIGLGVSGCDLVKERSKVVSKDDSLNSIVNGIKTSRKLQLNVVKMIEYIVSMSIAQILLMTFIVVSFNRVFFSPTLILWLNFINGLLPCFALGKEKIKYDINDKVNIDNLLKTRVKSNIFTYAFIQFILIGLVYVLGLFTFKLQQNVVLTMCFVALAFMEIFHAYNIKSHHSIFVNNPFNNKLLNWGVLISIICTILFVALPIDTLQIALNTTAITPIQWLISLGVGFAIVPIAEIIKLIKKLFRKK